MSKLNSLKEANCLGDVAKLLGFTPPGLSYVLFLQPETEKYKSFQIPKRSGGTREILAPNSKLKLLQKKLSDLLQDCAAEIDAAANRQDQISHGFKRDRSIITNARRHRNRRFVFNVDLADFFPSINFGRVRGYFIHDRNFALHPAVATVIAQIACHGNSLPQGSPCSPVISNLIARILDIHLVRLASANECTYSRYADDLTFSTNKKEFPADIASKNEDSWRVGSKLERLILHAGFCVNHGKTSMQFRTSRQVVTGLVVNKKVNIPIDYRRTTRAMVHSFLTTGRYETYASNKKAIDPAVEKKSGTPQQLHGMLGFIDSVDLFNKEKNPPKPMPSRPSSNELMYQRFLLYKDLYATDRPVVICEGQTDNIYLSRALRKLAAKFPQLVEVTSEGKPQPKIRLYKYRHTSTSRILGLNDGGSSSLASFISTYCRETERFKGPGQYHPVIILFDNDSGAKPIKKAISNITRKELQPGDAFRHIKANLYAVATPLPDGKDESCIEDFFDESIKARRIDGKSFSTDNEFNTEKCFGKQLFANLIVVPNTDTIDFTGFEKIRSERESVKPLILGRILQNHEFGPAGRHVLGLQQQVA